jgi:hypothetical protein
VRRRLYFETETKQTLDIKQFRNGPREDWGDQTSVQHPIGLEKVPGDLTTDCIIAPSVPLLVFLLTSRRVTTRALVRHCEMTISI